MIANGCELLAIFRKEGISIMMRLMSNKKNVKIVSSVVAVLFVLGVGAMAYTQMATPARASESSNIGVVDMSKLYNETSPDVVAAQKAMEEFAAQQKQEFEGKAASMDDQQKAQYMEEVQKKMEDKKMELQKGMRTKVEEAAKSVSESKGLTVVLNKDAVLYGGVDITDQVTKKLSGEAAK